MHSRARGRAAQQRDGSGAVEQQRILGKQGVALVGAKFNQQSGKDEKEQRAQRQEWQQEEDRRALRCCRRMSRLSYDRLATNDVG